MIPTLRSKNLLFAQWRRVNGQLRIVWTDIPTYFHELLRAS